MDLALRWRRYTLGIYQHRRFTAENSIAKAKLFFHGRSQAVRLPKEFRFEGTEVYVRRVGDEVVLSSKAKASMQSLVEALDDFEPGFELSREQPHGSDERAPLLGRLPAS